MELSNLETKDTYLIYKFYDILSKMTIICTELPFSFFFPKEIR